VITAIIVESNILFLVIKLSIRIVANNNIIELIPIKRYDDTQPPRIT
jgi:hypothetical protein